MHFTPQIGLVLNAMYLFIMNKKLNISPKNYLEALLIEPHKIMDKPRNGDIEYVQICPNGQETNGDHICSNHEINELFYF